MYLRQFPPPCLLHLPQPHLWLRPFRPLRPPPPHLGPLEHRTPATPLGLLNARPVSMWSDLIFYIFFIFFPFFLPQSFSCKSSAFLNLDTNWGWIDMLPRAVSLDYFVSRSIMAQNAYYFTARKEWDIYHKLHAEKVFFLFFFLTKEASNTEAFFFCLWLVVNILTATKQTWLCCVY